MSIESSESDPTLVKKPGGWEGRFRCGTGPRKRVLIGVADDRVAYSRARRMREVVHKLVAGKAKVADVVDFLEQAAKSQGADAFAGTCRAAVDVAKRGATPPTGPCTFRDVTEMWLSGMLHMRFPKTVPSQDENTAANNRGRIVRHIYPLLGDLAVRNITQDHYDAVMAKLPKRMLCRDKMAGLMVRVLDHAVRLKLIDENPIDPNTVPPARDPAAVAFTYLYPDEDRRLLACPDIPLARRLFYGTITRNGFRSADARGLVWGDVDFANGSITLDRNKTTPRCWQADHDVLRALERFRPAVVQADDTVFPYYLPKGLSAQLRRDLKTAGVDRRNLFVSSDKRRPIRLHDLRATFVTLAMACGRNEKWVKQRTGHTTSIMLSRYERRAGDAIEAGHNDWLVELDDVLWPGGAPQVGQRVGQVISIQRKTSRNGFTSTTSEPLQVHAGTQKPRANNPPAGTRKRGGPPGKGGVGQSGPVDLAGLTAAIASAAAAGKWTLVERLTTQLELVTAQLDAAQG